MALQPSLGMQRQREVSSAPGDSGMDTWQREPHGEPALPEGQINICVLEASISYTKTCNFDPFPFIFIRWNHLLKVLPKCPHETPLRSLNSAICFSSAPEIPCIKPELICWQRGLSAMHCLGCSLPLSWAAASAAALISSGSLSVPGPGHERKLHSNVVSRVECGSSAELGMLLLRPLFLLGLHVWLLYGEAEWLLQSCCCCCR